MKAKFTLPILNMFEEKMVLIYLFPNILQLFLNIKDVLR